MADSACLGTAVQSTAVVPGSYNILRDSYSQQQGARVSTMS